MPPGKPPGPETCKHNWQPVSFALEGVAPDLEGRTILRTPDAAHGRVYCVCLRCASHTFIDTEWAGFAITAGED